MEKRKATLMEKYRGKKPWFIIVLAAILIGSAVVPAAAGNSNRKLYGDYAANFSLNCATCGNNFTASAPFNPYAPACLPPGTAATTYTWNAQGIYTFDGRGNFEFNGRYMAVLRDKIFGAVSVVLPPKLKCAEGTYTVYDDLTVEAGFDECTVFGDEAELVKVHKIFNVNLRGRLMDRMAGPILLLTDNLDPASPPLPNIERVTDELSPNTPKPETYRICGMTGTAIPIKGQRMKRTE